MISAVIAASAIIAIAATDAMAQSWRFPHFGANNASLMPIMTAPAGAGSISVPNIGTFANGAGPVITLDGMVVIGNQQGRLMAFSETGAPVWNVALSGGEPIVASALISENAIYVVGATTTNAALYKFGFNGAEIFRAPFPQRRNRTIVTTAPNLTFSATADNSPWSPLIVLPTVYTDGRVAETRLLLFRESVLVIDQQIDIVVPQATGGSGLNTIPSPPIAELEKPLPMAASITDPATNLPVVVVADGFQTLVGYQVLGVGLREIFRYKDTKKLRAFNVTPTLTLGPTFALFATTSGTGFLTGSLDRSQEYKIPDRFSDTPHTLIPSALLSIRRDRLQIDNPNGFRSVAIPGLSIAPIAASLNYFYVSSEYAFTTYRTYQYAEVSRFDWVGGGRNPPVIGPKGHVYAMASNILFIFPAPTTIGTNNVSKLDLGAQNVATTDTGPSATRPSSQTYDPPLTTNGNRLFACRELDGDDCDKGDYKKISLAWCRKQGYPTVNDYDVDRERAKAETLDGRFCSKKKCKVFDWIDCGP